MITILSGIHIFYFDDSDWSLISKCLVCFAPIGIWVEIEFYFKHLKIENTEYTCLTSTLEKEEIEIVAINVQRIIKLEEYKDEADLYLIEQKDNSCVYLWDAEYLIQNSSDFPSEFIEIYQDIAVKFALDKKVTCYGNKLKMGTISGKCKWMYFGKHGFPGDLGKEDKNFEEVLDELKGISQNLILNK